MLKTPSDHTVVAGLSYTTSPMPDMEYAEPATPMTHFVPLSIVKCFTSQEGSAEAVEAEEPILQVCGPAEGVL